jgi:hypothetical protein
MGVGETLLDAALASGARSVAVVGTGKNVGKTVTMRALYEAAIARGLTVGLVSAGRDGEAIDAIDRNPKPRLWLVEGTWIASAPRTTRALERHPLPGPPIPTACGPIALARVVEGDYYELVGPPTVSGLRRAVEALRARCDFVLVDGAVDRLATIAGTPDALIVACGAAAAPTMDDAVDDVRALVERLSLRKPDGSAPALRIEGALFADLARELVSRNERRQVVVHTPAAIALDAKEWHRTAEILTLRSELEVRVLAVTVAPEGARRAFEPQAFARAVAQATGLPVYDVFAGTHALPAKADSWTR